MKKSKWKLPPDDREECIGCGYRRLLYITDKPTNSQPVWACFYCIENGKMRPQNEFEECLAYTTEVIHNYDCSPKNEMRMTTSVQQHINNGRPRKKKYIIKGIGK